MEDLFARVTPQQTKYHNLTKNNPSYTIITKTWDFGIEQEIFAQAIKNGVTHFRIKLTFAKPDAKDARQASSAGFICGDTYVCSIQTVSMAKRRAMGNHGTYYMVPVDKMEKVA